MASALALAALPSGSEAAGLGKVTVFSALGQPLRAEMEVFATREELAAMKVQLAPQDAFRQAGVEYTPTLSGITMTVDKRANGQPIIRLSSTKPINDPFVDLLLELNWATGRLIREYTFLLDPPEYAAKAAAAAPAIVRPTAAARQAVEASPAEDRPPRVAAYRPRASEQVQKPADGGGTHEVKRGETLSRIASDLRPEGVSLDQMLLGLFRANQDAFDQGNINRLKAGKILSIPDKATLEAIPKAEAKTVIIAQSSDWGGYRRKLAAAAGEAPGRDEGARQQAAGKVSTRVEERAGPSAEPKDQLRVSKTDLPGVKPLPPSKRTDEDLIAKEKALRDANERLASLERNVAELQRLVELKSQSLADLEKQSAGKTVPAEAKKPMDEARAAPPAPAVAAAAATGSAATGAPVSSAKPPDKPVEQASEVKPAEVVAKAEPRPEEVKPEAKAEVPPPPTAETAKPPEVPKPKPVVVPPPPEEPGFVEGLLGSPGALLGGGGIVALLAAYWFVKRRRESDGETPFDTSSTLAPLGDSVVPKSVFRSTGGQSVDTAHSIGQTDFSQAGPGSIDTDEVDPVAEADVYMAYGRDAQAEEILLEAKQKDPKRHAIQLKLLEIYLARKDAKPFEALAAELFKATDGTGSDWDKAVAMGRQLDPRNPLFGAAKAGDQAPQESGPTRSVRPEPAGSAMTMPARTEAMESSFTRPGQLSQVATAAGVVAAAGMAAGLADKEPLAATPEPAAPFADLDFDLGVSDAMPAAPSAPTESMLATTLSLPPRVEAAALDFDLADSMPASPQPESDGDVVQLVEDASAFDVTQLVGPASQKSSAEAEAGLDFDFDLAEALPEEAGWAAKTLTQGEPVEMLDIGSAGDDALEFDVRLTESTVLGEAMQHTAFDMSSISLDLAQPDLPSPEAAPVASAPLDFSFESDQEDTLVNPNFALEQTETQLSTQFGSATDVTSAEPEISSSEEVATKIELAKAYQEMGDLEGARELLQEVVNEGDAAQRDAAMALLDGLRE